MGIMQNGSIKSLAWNVLRRHWLFLIAFAGMAVFLLLSGPMNTWSSDAASIWHTIKSFYSGDIVSSYVLYKGFASVYPYVWLYQLSLLLGVGEFVFIKLYHCLLFAYVSTVGFPYLVENLLHIKAKTWRKAVLMVVLFWLWKNNRALDQLMVDLPSLAFFLLLVNSALKIEKLGGKRSWGRYIYTGLLLGLNMCISGQYTLPAVFILLFIAIRTVPRKVLREKALRYGALLCIVILLAGMSGVLMMNRTFEETVTNPLREKGEWIPTGQHWVEIGFMRLLGVMRSNPGICLPDMRGLNIAKHLYRDQFDVMYEAMAGGRVPMTIGQYFMLVAKYPLDFLTRYANRLFLALSPAGELLRFSNLFVGYTLLYIPFLIFKKRCTSVRRFFSAKMLIVLSFLLAIAPLVVLNIEMRCVMQLQGLIYSLALLDDTLWDGFKSFGKTVKECWATKSLRCLGQKKFPMTFAIYLFLMLFCFTHIASLYDLVGLDPRFVLFRF
jgi:hypothetical protein